MCQSSIGEAEGSYILNNVHRMSDNRIAIQLRYLTGKDINEKDVRKFRLSKNINKEQGGGNKIVN